MGQMRTYDISDLSCSREGVPKTRDKPNSVWRTYLTNKKILIPLILLVIVGVVLLVMPSGAKSKTTASVEMLDSEEYVKRLEDKLTNILSNIKGAGKVHVMLTITQGPEKVIATNSTTEETSTTNKDGSNVTDKNVESKPVVKNNDLYVLYEKLPEVTGVIVVSSGASDLVVRMQLISATSALLNISSNQIEIFEGI